MCVCTVLRQVSPSVVRRRYDSAHHRGGDDLCGIAVGEEGFAQGQELACFAVAVGVGAVAEGLGQTGISGVNCRLYYGPKLCG